MIEDYAERVYAGVLGKIIGVYLGRPIEGWSYNAITERFGEVKYYVHEEQDKPLIVADDDISGTFTFLRALPDHANDPGLTAAQIGETWLNYLIEGRTVLWWGGFGNSTEHTAYLRLKSGIEAPRSGSIELNGKVVAEQIGAQIFIDGWAMIAPGDPAMAADLAARAASVSHDGEAIYGAQVVAAMEAQAFVEPNIDVLLDTAVSFIPHSSVIYRMIGDLREWQAGGLDWRRAREQLEAHYGYDKYGGNCHMVPNHGVIILSLLYCDDGFQQALMIANTCGWDTDCNSGNVGCLMGIKNGLAGIDAGPDWRGPVADRLFLPTADGGRTITDAVIETGHIINAARALVGQQPFSPKNGARFHFELPGSVQGFFSEGDAGAAATVDIENVTGHSRHGERSLAVRYEGQASGWTARVATATFTPPTTGTATNYRLIASPTLYPGQTVRAGIEADGGNGEAVTCSLYHRAYDSEDELVRSHGQAVLLQPGARAELEWRLGQTDGTVTMGPIAEIGVAISGNAPAAGSVYLDYLTWSGVPDVVLGPPEGKGTMWRQAWVDGTSVCSPRGEPFRLIQNSGTGLLIQGTREWTDYRVSADVTPHLVAAAGIAARVQGMRRYYALLLCRNGSDGNPMARLVKALDGSTVLAEVDWPWELGTSHELSLQVTGASLRATIDGKSAFDIEDSERPLTGGAVALVCEEGRTATQRVTVVPA